jgi:hypothetical protein
LVFAFTFVFALVSVFVEVLAFDEELGIGVTAPETDDGWVAPLGP